MGRKAHNDSTSRAAKQRAMEDSASVYRLKQRIANLEYTNAKTARILMETKAKQNDRDFSLEVENGLWQLVSELRAMTVKLLLSGNTTPPAEVAARMSAVIELFVERNGSLFKTTVDC